MNRDKVLALAIAFIKKHKTYPTMNDMAKLGATKKTVEYHFGNMGKLKDEAYELSGGVIFDLNRDGYKNVPSEKTKRFVITTAVTNAPVLPNFLKNIKAYCKDFKAELLVLPSVEHAASGWLVDPILQNEVIIAKDYQLNNNARILGILSNARTVDPVTGLPRLGQRNGTFIAASPKQRLKYVATGVNSLPHALMTTGAVTLPWYRNTGLMANKTVYTANHDHVMGAIILEIQDDNIYHFRQIQADKHGSFVDLGNYYKDGERGFMAPAALVPGDWHSGSTDPAVVKCLVDINKKLSPACWVINDFFDGISVNPHILGKNITRAKMADKLNLEQELKLVKKDLEFICAQTKKVIVVRSNHDEFLDRYLESGLYVEEPQNHRIALQLAMYKLDGKNPLEEYVGKNKQVLWLEIDESLRIAGAECGAHGHKGANGAPGNINSMENAYGDVIFGHSHTPQILRRAWNVGTSTFMDLGYNKGASSWVQTFGILYPNGQRQLINVIEGKYTI